jgi:hypothetical protein
VLLLLLALVRVPLLTLLLLLQLKLVLVLLVVLLLPNAFRRRLLTHISYYKLRTHIIIRSENTYRVGMS